MPASRSLALALGSLLLAAIASPVRQNFRAHKVDDFPLSYYPMFSAQRSRRGHVVHVVVDDAGGTHPVPYELLGTGGFNQVRRQIARRAATPEGAEHLAREVLEGLGADRVRIVRSTFEYDLYFRGSRTPSRVHTLGIAERNAS